MDIYQEVARIIARNDTAALCVIVQASGSTPRNAGTKMLVFPDGKFIGTVGGGELEQRVITAALDSMQDGLPAIIPYTMADPERGDPGVCGGQLEVYVEPILPQPQVVVIGAGHVGREVASLAHWLGFSVVISDDRAELLKDDDLAALGEVHHCEMQALAELVNLHRQSYLILTTRNVDVDVAGMPALLASQAGFIGVIGSRRRWETTRKQLLEAGIAPEVLEKVHSPVGLELEAETPKEIAVSIMAQIIMLRNGGDGSTMAR
jgi:xanthine dehydrogenase accessory factor